MRDGFAALGVDLIALQETLVTGEHDQVAEIVGDDYRIVHSRSRAADGVGVSIASRWPIADVEELVRQGSTRGLSVCYRDAWERVHPGESVATFTPRTNPLVADRDWPFQRIDHVLVRCGVHGGPTLDIRDCRRIFDDPPASDHYGMSADLD